MSDKDTSAAGSRDKAGAGSLKQLRQDMTLRGGVRSAIATGSAGIDAIKSGAAGVAEATRKGLQPGRSETFEMAMQRLQVPLSRLPLIHNQLALQAYVSFFIAVAAATVGIVLMVNGGPFAGITAMAIGAAAVVNAMQASLRAYRIRRRQLGLLDEWLRSPGHWLPSRLEGLEPMQAAAALRAPERLARLAARAMAQFWIGIGFGLAAMVAWLAGGFSVANTLGLTLLVLCAVMLALFANTSFDVFRKRLGLECDALLWLQSPHAWLPRIRPAPDAAGQSAAEPRRRRRTRRGGVDDV